MKIFQRSDGSVLISIFSDNSLEIHLSIANVRLTADAEPVELELCDQKEINKSMARTAIFSASSPLRSDQKTEDYRDIRERQMKSPQFASYSRFVGTKQNHRLYAWCVFVDTQGEAFRGIREIEYTLHPSFPDRVRVINDPNNCFVLESRGWDEFQLRTRTSFNDGSVTKGTFYLKLRDNGWPLGGPLSESVDFACRKIYSALIEEEWDWRRISTLARKAQTSIEETRAYLHDLARTRTVRRAHYLSFDDQELWGGTSRVGLLPEPK